VRHISKTPACTCQCGVLCKFHPVATVRLVTGTIMEWNDCHNVLFCGVVGNFCPVCRRCYVDDDWDSQMMQCYTCHHWVHATCEELTGISAL